MFISSTNPGPGNYQIKGEIQSALDHKKGWQIGIGREVITNLQENGIKWHSWLNQTSSKNRPWTIRLNLNFRKYCLLYEPENQSHRYIQSYADAKQKMNIPGPGAYQSVNTMPEKGRIFISRFASSGACIINPASQ